MVRKADPHGAYDHIITPIEEAWAHLPVPAFPNDAAGSEGPSSWHELLEIRGNTAEPLLIQLAEDRFPNDRARIVPRSASLQFVMQTYTCQ